MDVSCRVCLEEKETMVDIFEEVEQFHTDLASLLENCGGISIELDDPFPKYLCQQCTEELFAVAEFREKCKLSTKLFLEMKQKALDENAARKKGKETMITTERVQKKVSSTESALIYEPVVVDDENVDMSLTEYAVDTSTKVDPVEINIVFENDPNDTGAIKTSINDEANSIGNVIQLVLPNHTQYDNNVIEETLTEVGAEEIYDNAEFADSIIEVLENEETEISSEQNEVYPTTSLKSTENYNYVCEACGAVFKKCINLRRHMEIGHNTILEFFCEKCHRKFGIEKDYQRHIEIGCEEIEKTSTKPTLKGSESKKKANQASTKHICDYCGKVLQSLFSLRMHERVHTGERPFNCDKCQGQFKTQAALTAHEKRHVGNADLICEVCEKRFIDPSNLIVHRRTHSGIRPHKCNVCGQTFSRVYLLQLHMRTHTGERPFECEYCLKTFSQSSDFKYHLAIHSGERKYSCPMCPKTFIRRGKLEVHMEKHSTPSTQEALQNDDSILSEENSVFFTNVQNDMDLDVVNVNDDDLY